MLLSIGIMVKNEEKNLEDCLMALQPLLDNIESELIIVDTGSIDRTVEIAKKFTDKVYFHKWNDDFSEMRNITISYCTGEWFFCIDADEVVENTEKLIKFFKSEDYKKFNTCTLIVKNYLYTGNIKEYNTLESNRLFKKDDDFKYIGAVHNQPKFKMPIKKIDCIINHYGYIMDDEKLMEKKYLRTSSLLKKELEKDPNNIYYKYQLISSYSIGNRIIDALSESDILYNLLSENDKKIHKYVLTQRAQLLVATKRTYECEELCNKELKLTACDEIYKIDLMYYLAKSQFIQGKFELALKNYKKYFKLVSKFEKGELTQDTTLVNRSISLKNYVYNDMVFIYDSQKDYDNVIKYSLRITDDTIVVDLLHKLIKAFINLKNYDGLFKYYINLSKNLQKEFCDILEENKLMYENSISVLLEEIFSQDNSEYGLLNRIRLSKESEFSKHEILNCINNLNLEEKESYYGDILYKLLCRKYDLRTVLRMVKNNTVVSFLEFCNKKYNDFSKVILEYIKEIRRDYNEFDSLRINIILCRVILIINKISEESYIYVFEKYMEIGLKYIRFIYSEYILDNELIMETKNNEDSFFIYILKANEIKENNKSEYIKYLNKALKSYPYMKKGIQYLLNDISKQENKNNDNLNKLKDKLIVNIKVLIASGKVDEAINVINEYEEIMGMDFEVLLLKSQMIIG